MEDTVTGDTNRFKLYGSTYRNHSGNDKKDTVDSKNSIEILKRYPFLNCHTKKVLCHFNGNAQQTVGATVK